MLNDEKKYFIPALPEFDEDEGLNFVFKDEPFDTTNGKTVEVNVTPGKNIYIVFGISDFNVGDSAALTIYGKLRNFSNTSIGTLTATDTGFTVGIALTDRLMNRIEFGVNVDLLTAGTFTVFWFEY